MDTNEIIRRLEGIPNGMVANIDGRMYSSSELISDIKKNYSLNKLICKQWESVLEYSVDERLRLRSKFRIRKDNSINFNSYYTQERVLGFWVFNIGMFVDVESADSFLNGCIEGDLFRKYFNFRKK